MEGRSATSRPGRGMLSAPAARDPRNRPMDVVDLTPETMECMRCHREAPMRFYGLCTECRAELRAKYDRGARVVEVADYEPKMNVTPNAVALKDD
jgi:hypothetical protein